MVADELLLITHSMSFS